MSDETSVVQESPDFRYVEEDCRRYVKKGERPGRPLWEEVCNRLKQWKGFDFRAVPFKPRADWLETIWFHPANTSRSKKDWNNQAQLFASRSMESKTVSFGLMVERATPQDVEKYGWTTDRDSDRLMALLEQDENFRGSIDALIRQDGFHLHLHVWGREKRVLPSCEEALELIRSLPPVQGWGFIVARILSCAEAVALGTTINEEMMRTYERVWPFLEQVWPPSLRKGVRDNEPPDASTDGPIAALLAHLATKGFHFPRHLVTTYYLALQSKPFVILSGISGSGKTKLARLFADFVATGDNSAFVPVHPDWTDHRGLLGFPHLLTGTYYATGFLRLLLRAWVDWVSGQKQPHFVLLDEMNLARVEHYFADFLSVLESRLTRDKPERFSLHDHPRCLLIAGNEEVAREFYADAGSGRTCAVQCTGCPFQELVPAQYRGIGRDLDQDARIRFDPRSFVPPHLEVPLNVYFTGTVNVDESTFTFSPKVLDRAFVIEFDEVDLAAYWRQGANPPPPDRADIVSALTHDRGYPFILLGRSPEARTARELAPYRTQLDALVRLLEPFHMHFAYRVADEVLAYLSNARRLNDPGFPLEVAFDHALLHKVLPRFHGSAGRLREPVHRLLAFCSEAGRPQEGDTGQTLAERVTAQSREWKDATWTDMRTNLEQARLRLSAKKLLRMLHDLDTEGFTSFT